MEDTSLVENSQVEKSQYDLKVELVIRQTNYSQEVAREKLELFGHNELAVIREFMGIPEKKETQQIKSLNQSIYRQLRGHLDSAMKDYRDRADKGDTKIV
jgi:hypothetical protein